VWKAYPGAGDGIATFTLPDGTAATLHTTKGLVEVQGTSPQSRDLEITVALEAAPGAVVLDGKPTNGDYDAAARVLHVKVTGSGFSLSVSR
jgi:hypothetical protein